MLKLLNHTQYQTPRLIPSSLTADPLELFRHWLKSALEPAEGEPAVREPEAMVLGTVREGRPSSRTVLLKGEPVGRRFFDLA